MITSYAVCGVLTETFASGVENSYFSGGVLPGAVVFRWDRVRPGRRLDDYPVACKGHQPGDRQRTVLMNVDEKLDSTTTVAPRLDQHRWWGVEHRGHRARLARAMQPPAARNREQGYLSLSHELSHCWVNYAGAQPITSHSDQQTPDAPSRPAPRCVIAGTRRDQPFILATRRPYIGALPPAPDLVATTPLGPVQAARSPHPPAPTTSVHN
jgi:hypothetical protein